MKRNSFVLIIYILIFTGCGLSWWSGTPKTYLFEKAGLYITQQEIDDCEFKFYFHDSIENPGTDYVVFSKCPTEIISIQFSYVESNPKEISIIYDSGPLCVLDSVVSSRYIFNTWPGRDFKYEEEMRNRHKILVKDLDYRHKKQNWEDSIKNRPGSVVIYPDDFFDGFSYFKNGKFMGPAKLMKTD